MTSSITWNNHFENFQIFAQDKLLASRVTISCSHSSFTFDRSLAKCEHRLLPYELPCNSLLLCRHAACQCSSWSRWWLQCSRWLQKAFLLARSSRRLSLVVYSSYVPTCKGKLSLNTWRCLIVNAYLTTDVFPDYFAFSEILILLKDRHIFVHALREFGSV